ncbi:MAG: 6-bladed beta-propeller [Phormidesmis sp. FL-bin-119]|nr:6-bladed beta-propeller [Pedobacter sp.]
MLSLLSFTKCSLPFFTLMLDHLLLSLCLVFPTDLGKVLSKDTTALHEIRINPKTALAQEVFAEDAFNSVEYFPLQTTKQSLFGTIDQLEITPEYFFILEKNHRQVNYNVNSAVLIFKRSGAFHTKIITVECFSFAINRFSNEIVVIDYRTQSNLVYNYNGKLIRTDKRDFFSAALEYTSPSTIMAYKNYISDDINIKARSIEFGNLVLTDTLFKPLKAFLPFDTLKIFRQEINAGTTRFFSRSGEKLYFHTPYFSEIYEIKDNQLYPQYKFILPLVNSLPQGFGNNQMFYKQRLAHIDKHPEQVYDITNFFESDDMLTFKLYSQKTRNSFLYSLKTGNLIDLQSVEPDNKLLSVPLSEDILSSDGKSLITFAKASSILDHERKRKSERNPANHSSAIGKIIETGSMEVNPILIFLKPKT